MLIQDVILIKTVIGMSILGVIAWIRRARNPRRVSLDSSTGQYRLEVVRWGYEPSYWCFLFAASAGLTFILCLAAQSARVPRSGVFFLFLLLLFVLFNDEDLKFLTRRKFAFFKHGQLFSQFELCGGSWEYWKEFLWMPDDSGLLIVSHRDMTTPIHLMQIDALPGCSGDKFYFDPPASREIKRSDQEFWTPVCAAYGFNPLDPREPESAAPLSHRHSEVQRFFDRYPFEDQPVETQTDAATEKS